MKSIRLLVAVGLAVGSMALLFAGCGSKTCGSANCANGCCDSSGTCISATSATACGSNGATCTSCQLGQVCTLGTCTLPSGSGGGSGTGGGNSATGGGSSTGGGVGTGGGSGSGLIGTWALTTTPNGGSPTTTTLIIGQDSLNVTGTDWTLTAIRTNNTETYTENGSTSSSHGSAAAVQTPGTFNTGVIPFSMGGAWVVTAGGTSSQPELTCNMQVTATEIDANCVDPGDTYNGLNFIFTTSRSNPSTSVYGDLGGTWNQTWYHTADAGSMEVDTCVLNFGGSNFSTCITGNHPLANLTFTLNAAQTMASGTASGAEFSAVKQ